MIRNAGFNPNEVIIAILPHNNKPSLIYRLREKLHHCGVYPQYRFRNMNNLYHYGSSMPNVQPISIIAR
jgi:hypothetical protein